MVTSDLGRVTTKDCKAITCLILIVVTSDLGRVTTIAFNQVTKFFNCGDVRSRTSYNWYQQSLKQEYLKLW